MKENLQETIPATRPGARPGENGAHPQGGPPIQPSNGTKPRGRGIPMAVVLPIVLIVLVAAGYFGYQYWLNQQLYVYTDNAQIAGTLVQVGAVNAGRIDSIGVDIGDKVQENQVVASVLLPSTIGMTQSGTPLLGFVGTENLDARTSSRPFRELWSRALLTQAIPSPRDSRLSLLSIPRSSGSWPRSTRPRSTA